MICAAQHSSAPALDWSKLLEVAKSAFGAFQELAGADADCDLSVITDAPQLLPPPPQNVPGHPAARVHVVHSGNFQLYPWSTLLFEDCADSSRARRAARPAVDDEAPPRTAAPAPPGRRSRSQ